jgi:hypothetical protein
VRVHCVWVHWAFKTKDCLVNVSRFGGNDYRSKWHLGRRWRIFLKNGEPRRVSDIRGLQSPGDLSPTLI